MVHLGEVEEEQVVGDVAGHEGRRLEGRDSRQDRLSRRGRGHRRRGGTFPCAGSNTSASAACRRCGSVGGGGGIPGGPEADAKAHEADVQGHLGGVGA